MNFVFYILAALLIYFSLKSFAGGVAYLQFFRRELGREPSAFAPPATVFVPCRGLDQGLAENLAPLFAQDYPDYEIVFVVDSADDPAVRVIDLLRESASGSRTSKVIVAGRADGESQKVRNLRDAVPEAREASAVFVFADSDVRPAVGWLRALIGPLADPSVGCATGYRWFVSRRWGLASELRSVWNASIASALGPNRKGNFCWGGSTAIRRETFERIAMRDRWRGTLSDDFTMTRAMNENGLGIVFVPRALTASLESCSWRELFEFTTRQMKITRVYAVRLWLLSFFGSGLFLVVMAWAVLLAATSVPGSIGFAAALVTLVSVSLLSVGKSAWRLRAVRLALPEHARDVRWIPQCVLWIFSPPIFLANCLAALFSRRICWRGTTYELRSPTETLIVGNRTDF